MDLSAWRYEHGLYLFCLSEFRVAVASVYLHHLGYRSHTAGNFLDRDGESPR